jgi:hypothetical protein
MWWRQTPPFAQNRPTDRPNLFYSDARFKYTGNIYTVRYISFMLAGWRRLYSGGHPSNGVSILRCSLISLLLLLLLYSFYNKTSSLHHSVCEMALYHMCVYWNHCSKGRIICET